jgi:hypothetical protein
LVFGRSQSISYSSRSCSAGPSRISLSVFISHRYCFRLSPPPPIRNQLSPVLQPSALIDHPPSRIPSAYPRPLRSRRTTLTRMDSYYCAVFAGGVFRILRWPCRAGLLLRRRIRCLNGVELTFILVMLPVVITIQHWIQIINHLNATSQPPI